MKNTYITSGAALAVLASALDTYGTFGTTVNPLQTLQLSSTTSFRSVGVTKIDDSVHPREKQDLTSYLTRRANVRDRDGSPTPTKAPSAQVNPPFALRRISSSPSFHGRLADSTRSNEMRKVIDSLFTSSPSNTSRRRRAERFTQPAERSRSAGTYFESSPRSSKSSRLSTSLSNASTASRSLPRLSSSSGQERRYAKARGSRLGVARIGINTLEQVETRHDLNRHAMDTVQLTSPHMAKATIRSYAVGDPLSGMGEVQATGNAVWATMSVEGAGTADLKAHGPGYRSKRIRAPKDATDIAAHFIAKDPNRPVTVTASVKGDGGLRVKASNPSWGGHHVRFPFSTTMSDRSDSDSDDYSSS